MSDENRTIPDPGVDGEQIEMPGADKDITEETVDDPAVTGEIDGD